MDGKTVILGVLIMSLVMAQNQVEAWSCCPTTMAKNTYNTCRLIGGGTEYCAKMSKCPIVSGNTCPPEFPYIVDGNYGDALNEYCKLGCASSMCGALISSDASEIGAVAQCTNACSNFCSKGSATAVEAA